MAVTNKQLNQTNQVVDDIKRRHIRRVFLIGTGVFC